MRIYKNTHICGNRFHSQKGFYFTLFSYRIMLDGCQ